MSVSLIKFKFQSNLRRLFSKQVIYFSLSNCRFETALRQKDSSVVLPYWNSVIDNNNVTGPQNTPIFTNSFLGDGRNVLNSGPFGTWTDFRGCPLTRDVGGRNTTPLTGNCRHDNK